MKTTKFRCWDKDTKQMYDNCEIKYSNGAWQAFKPTGEAVMNFELLQYTTLDDKSGKEIYEGDIVKMVGYSSAFDRYIEVKWQTVYNEEVDEEFSTGYDLTPDGCYRYEIIGNKYQNPELLQQHSILNK